MAECGGDEKASVSTPTVFISYASQDAAVANSVVEALEQHNIGCWIAPRDVTPGASYAGQIIHAIDAANASVLILSHDAASSPHVLREVERAASKRHPIISLRIDQAPLPADFEYFLNTSHWLDGSATDIAHTLPKLVAAVQLALQAAAVMPGDAPSVHATAPSAPPTNRTAIVVASLVGLAVVGFAADRLWLSGRRAAAPPTTTLAPDAAAFNPPAHAIAVLPFANISGDKEQEYFSDGLSEELIDHLVHSVDLKVIARTSSFQFKGRNEDVRSIARKLGVAYVLEGSVRKDGEQVRITAQLIRASDGVHLWSQSYDRNLIDIFTVQDEIADKVSQALRVALPYGHRAENRKPDIRAYNLVLEGNYFKARRTLRDVEKAAQLYQQAIDVDPNYALAWARLASAYLSAEILKGPPSEEQNRRVLDALGRAMALDPNLVWTYYTRGGFEMNVTWNWAAAQADTERMREIDPRSDLLPSAFGDIALTFGEVDRAVEFYQDEVERNPLDPNTLDSLGVALCAANRLEQCLQARLRALQLHPEFDGANSSVGIARLYLGQFAAALTAMQREPNEDYRLRGLAIAYAALRQRSASDAALSSLTEKFASSDAYGIAVAHAYRGEVDDAFRWLDRAYRQHDAGMPDLIADPLLRNLHSDRRFQALLIRMRLTGQRQSVSADAQT